MNKYLPFVFPLAALLIVVFLAFRWFSMQTGRPDDQISEGVQIEDLTTDEADQMLRGTGDFEEAELQGEGENQGAIRYETAEERVRFSVMANLPQPNDGFYQVWIVSGDESQKAFRLAENKGGYTGSAALSQSALPLEIIVSQETQDDETMENVVLRGTIAE